MRSNFHILCLAHFDKNIRSLQLIGYDIVVDVAVSQVSNKMGFLQSSTSTRDKKSIFSCCISEGYLLQKY